MDWSLERHILSQRLFEMGVGIEEYARNCACSLEEMRPIVFEGSPYLGKNGHGKLIQGF